MLEQLSCQTSRLTDTFYLEWLSLGKKLFEPLSPVASKKRKRLFSKSLMEINSPLSVFSNETKILKSFLIRLAEEGDSKAVLKELFSFFAEGQGKVSLKHDDICRFVLGDPGSKGFLNLCFSADSESHFLCASFIECLLKLLNRSENPFWERFQKVVFGLPPKKFWQVGIDSHVGCSGLKKCKILSFQFIELYERANPKSPLGSLLKEENNKKQYLRWRETRPLLNRCFENVLILGEQSPPDEIDLNQPILNVFGTPCNEQETENKKQTFRKEAEDHFKQIGCSAGFSSKVDIVNSEMAEVRLLLPYSSGSQVSKFSKVGTNLGLSPNIPQAIESSSQQKILLERFKSYISTPKTESLESTDKIFGEIEPNIKSSLTIETQSTKYILEIEKQIQTALIKPTTDAEASLCLPLAPTSGQGQGTSSASLEALSPLFKKGDSTSSISRLETREDLSLDGESRQKTPDLPTAPKVRGLVCGFEGELRLNFQSSEFNGIRSHYIGCRLFLSAASPETRELIRTLPGLSKPMETGLTKFLFHLVAQ